MDIQRNNWVINEACWGRGEKVEDTEYHSDNTSLHINVSPLVNVML